MRDSLHAQEYERFGGADLAGLLEPGPPDQSGADEPRTWSTVPWRTICGTVAVVLATYVTILVILATAQILSLVLVAGFFAIVLAPLVNMVQRHVRDRRGLATGIVVFSMLLGMIGLALLFVLPVRTQLAAIITDLPGTVHTAANGKGPIGRVVTQLHLERYVKDNETELAKAASQLSASPFDTARTVLGVALALVTVTLLTFLFLTQSSAMARAARGMVHRRRHAAVNRVAADAAAAVSGYMIGNLLISAIAGVTAFACLALLGVPSPVVLALWVAFADLIPLVGATLGAIVCILAAYLHSPTAGVVSLIFFVIYQQIENGVLYPWLMARKVKVNPLVVLLSVLFAVELFGIVGALLAVPVSGAVQVVVKATRHHLAQEQLVLPEEEPSA